MILLNTRSHRKPMETTGTDATVTMIIVLVAVLVNVTLHSGLFCFVCFSSGWHFDCDIRLSGMLSFTLAMKYKSQSLSTITIDLIVWLASSNTPIPIISLQTAFSHKIKYSF